jgi:WD40 repeat protein
MRHLTISLLFLTLCAGGISAQQPPSYGRDVRPFLTKYCLECHNSKDAKGGLDLETYKGLRAGGDNGEVLTPGRADASRLVLRVEGKEKPTMPPKKARFHPTAREIPVLRAWVAAGAKDDSTAVRVVLPAIPSRVHPSAPVTALAYSPDGSYLAVGAYKSLHLLNPRSLADHDVLHAVNAPITALAFSRDGKRLAVAVGTSGEVSDLLIYSVPPRGKTSPVMPAPLRVPAAHQDVIQQMAFRPDDKLLATCSYDRQVKLWDTATFKEPRVLKEHSDSVYGVAFSPDGSRLASGAADRAVKVYAAATGKLLYTLGEPTDWVYAVAFSPDGKHLAAGGVDRSIRVWEVSASGGRVVQSVFAHEAPVTRLVFAADGKTLYSVSEDHTVKAWDAAHMVERKVYARQPEEVLALAVSPDHKQLALGRYDGALVLLDDATGKVQAQPLPVKPQPPAVTRVSPPSGQRGLAVRLRFEGKHLDGVTEVVASQPGVRARVLSEGRNLTALEAEVTFPAATPPGVYQVRLKGPAGESGPLSFTVDPFPLVAEQEPNNSPGTGQPIRLPVTVAGVLDRAGDTDWYRFEAKAGQELGVQVQAEAGSKLDPFLKLTDAAGRLLAEGGDGHLGYTFAAPGTYALGVRDREFRGNASMHYRLHLGGLPVVTAVYPLGLQRGTEANVHVEGVYLGPVRAIKVKAAADAAPGTRLPLRMTTPAGTPLGLRALAVGEFPDVQAQEGAVPALPVPGTANGRISKPGITDTWRFMAKKGQRLILEVNARRLGSPLDSIIEVLNPQGRPVPRAVLRPTAKTYVTFRDHGSSDPGIRIEAWSEFAINDYVYVGTELLRIKELPPNPDADCLFFSDRGQRLGYQGTTPTHLSMGTPMYKVSVHPPGTTFPPNGFPVITLYYRNDDGGPGYGRDSQLTFDPPADGEYLVRIGDSRGQGGPGYAYRLTVRPPRPSYNISFNPTAPAVWKGSAVPVTVSAQRIDGFDGPIDVRLENVPPGFHAPATTVPAGENSTAFALWADAGAASPPKMAPPLKLTAQAVIEGQVVRREAAGSRPTAVEPGEIVTTTDLGEVSLRPGGTTRLTVHVQRRKGFAGRIPVEVRGLPHGVRVLDIGLNGILITEQQTSRTVVIYCEPWVTPRDHPFVVLARHEGTGREFAARSVLLRMAGQQPPR